MAHSNPGIKAFPSSAIFPRHTRVKIDFTATPPTVGLAGSDDEAHGEAEGASTRVGEHVSVKLYAPVCIREVAGAVAQYARVYEADAGRVDDALAGGQGAGIALDAAAAAGERIAVLEDAARGKVSGLRHVNVADSDAVTAAVETTFSNGSKTLDGPSLRVGDVIRVKAGVSVATTTGSETVNIKAKIGTEEIVATGAVDVANGDIALIEFDAVVRAAGAAGALLAYGTYSLGVPGTVTQKPFRKAQASEDLSGDVAVEITTTASGTGESVELEHFTVEVLRK